MKTYENTKFPYHFIGVVLLVASLIAAGCGSINTTNRADEKQNTEQNVKTYYVGTRGTLKPFTYLNDKEQLTGYDIEILKEVEKRNKGIHFEFKTMSVESAFVALGSKQVDLIANQMSKNPDREAKYSFTSEVNNYTSAKITVKGDRNDIQNLKDLEGKTMILTPTSEVARKIKEYNETAETKINLIFTDKGSAESLNVVATGRADADASYEVTVKEARETLGLDVKSVGSVLSSVPTYFILRQDDDAKKLAQIIDKSVKEMKADGTLKKLSEQFLGADYTVKPE